ncbi:MAG: 3-phosphoshikimate 1-carboxyvinyltransferase, partial [Halobacteria archaeon]|nr:3-phosphoshikimate 1-carboxyvinyltransferase [Halobacteria archaeon]
IMRVVNPLRSSDTEASIRCSKAFGARVRSESEEDLVIKGTNGSPRTPEDVLDCGNSGTTLRLFTGEAALCNGITVLTGDESLRSRPNGPLLDALNSLGVEASSTRYDGCAPLVVEGPLEGGATSIDGSVSSQFISSLLFAAPLTTRGIELNIKNELRSRPYVDITLDVLERTGIEYEETDKGFGVEGNQSYECDEFRVPGDFSSASYLLAAGAIAGDGRVEVSNLFPSAQGDSIIIGVLKDMGAEVEWDEDGGVVRIRKGNLRGTEFDASDNPDLVPTIAVLGAVAEGKTRIINAEHLRYKETDRLEAMATELAKMNAEVEQGDDYLIIDGSSSDLKGANVSGWHDHRVVMSLAIAALAAEGETVIDTAESVNVSYPEFTDSLFSLGGNIRKVS